MLKRKVRSLLAVGATVGLLTAAPGIASAAGTPALFPNSNYGFDGNANLAVGGGSVTLYYVAQSLARTYTDTQNCLNNLSAYNAASSTYPPSAVALNQCVNGSAALTTANPIGYSGPEAGGDFDGDTIAIAYSTGSSAGIGALNGAHNGAAATYAMEGTNSNLAITSGNNQLNGANGYGTPDFALSSRGPKASGGNCAAPGSNGDEEDCDTFWGFASDGVEIMTFNQSAGAYDTGATNVGSTGGFSAQDIYDIYSCQITTWGQLPEWKSENAAYLKANPSAKSDPNLPASAAPIVPWSMNSNSGTYQDFINWVTANSSAPSSFTPDTACARTLSNGNAPVENDVKPIVSDANLNAFKVPTYPAGTTSPYPSGTTSYPAGISTDATSPQNPVNWLWFGSYGLLNEFPYLSGGTLGFPAATAPSLTSVTYSTSAVPLASGVDPTNGLLPSQTDIGDGSYPALRILSLVTRNTDATCPLDSSGLCDFSQSVNPGPTNGNGVADIDVPGASSGVAGAVREFMRWLCRPSAATEPTDIYTGINDFTEIKADIAGSGFESIPASKASPGSSCDVLP